MNRKRWNNDENQMVLDAMVAALRVNPRLDSYEVLRAGQQVLNPERRIVVNGQRVFNHKARIQLAREIASRSNVVALTAEAASAVPAAAAPAPASTTLEQLARVFEQLIDIVADRVADKLAERMQPAPSMVEVEKQINEQFDLEYRKHNPEPTPAAPRKQHPGVLVLGLLNQTGEQLRREFKDQLDIEWHDTDEATTRGVHPMAHVVLMTKFINHNVQERWRKAGRVHYCNGGVSQLREVLRGIAS